MHQIKVSLTSLQFSVSYMRLFFKICATEVVFQSSGWPENQLLLEQNSSAPVGDSSEPADLQSEGRSR